MRRRIPKMSKGRARRWGRTRSRRLKGEGAKTKEKSGRTMIGDEPEGNKGTVPQEGGYCPASMMKSRTAGGEGH